MSWLAWIVFGLIAGALAKLIMPGPDGGGWIKTILLGELCYNASTVVLPTRSSRIISTSYPDFTCY